MRHILIVEDHRDLAQLLQSGLQSMAGDFHVTSVPSGEEAMLVAKDSAFDLLVVDVLLPGMSGLELMARLKRQQPEIKTILITAATDHATHKEVANAGAEAFFFKPVELSELREAIRRCLGPLEPLPPPSAPDEVEEPTETVSDRLARLRQDLKAIAAALLDERGQPVVQAGEFPGSDPPETLLPAVMGVFSAQARLGLALGSESPTDLAYVSGREGNLALAHVGSAYALLVIVPKGTPVAQLAPLILGAGKDVLEILSRLGVPTRPAEPPPSPEPAPEEILPEIDVSAPELDALLERADEMSLSREEVDAYWATPEKSIDTGSLSADDLSYDQARKLGLTPEEEAEA